MVVQLGGVCLKNDDDDLLLSIGDAVTANIDTYICSEWDFYHHSLLFMMSYLCFCTALWSTLVLFKCLTNTAGLVWINVTVTFILPITLN